MSGDVLLKRSHKLRIEDYLLSAKHLPSGDRSSCALLANVMSAGCGLAAS